MTNRHYDYVWFSKNLREIVSEEKIERKGRRKEKVKKNKISLNLINYFHMLLQTHFIYLSLLYKD